ncbi:hypothetical protein A4G31_27210 [Mycobacterium persicum]|nr:hypothetical protein A4G31_27210 [Mycobacterium persicum]
MSDLDRAEQAEPTAIIESVSSRTQTELRNRHRWRTRIESANAIFEFQENVLKRQRRHSALGIRTPRELELLLQSTDPVA